MGLLQVVVVNLQVVRPVRVALIGGEPAEVRAMAEARQALDAATARGTAEAPAQEGRGMQVKVVPVPVAALPMGAEQLLDRVRGHGRTVRVGTRQSARERVLTGGVATRDPLRRRGRTDRGPRMIGPVRAVRTGETLASAATGHTVTQLALARNDLLETRVLSVETAVRDGVRQRRTRIGVRVPRLRGRPVRATAIGRKGRTAGRVRLIPGRRVRVIGVVPRGRTAGRAPLIRGHLVRATAIARRARIVAPARLIPALLVRATASGLRDWFVGHARRILGRRVRAIAVVPRVPIVGHVRRIPGRRVRAIAVVPRVQIVGLEAVPVGRCVATIGRRALSGSYGHPSSRDQIGRAHV